MIAELFAQVPNADEHPLVPVTREGLELPRDEGPTCDLEHGLGQGERARLHARGQPASQDHCLHAAGSITGPRRRRVAVERGA